VNVCLYCGIPADAGVFDDSSIRAAPAPGKEEVLARYQLHRNYCGVLLYFAQFTDKYANDPKEVATPGYEWELRCNGRPRDPYLRFEHIVNPWGLSGFPIHLRLEEECLLELAVLNAGDNGRLGLVGGRILGRYWYNADFGGAPNRL
jgi:hypothetical protein